MDELRRLAAEAAVDLVADGMVLGLGTGRTARHMIAALAARLRDGRLTGVVGVPTSLESAGYAGQLGIPLTSLDDQPWVDLAIDGADEFTAQLDLIKGRGGALMREKIVAVAAERLVVVVDEGKRVDYLGQYAPLPVEVLPFGWRTHLPLIEYLGGCPALRCNDAGQPALTDNGNYLIDVTFPGGIPDPAMVERELDAQPGIIGHGLFLGIAAMVIVGTSHGIEVLERAP